MKRARIASIVIAISGLAVSAALAGPLNPPGGPVSSSYKTLSEVEPRIAINATNTPGDSTCTYLITQPGSYYLTGNVTGASARSGIKIAASDVTLDLNGFTLTGVSGSYVAIGVVGAPANVTVMHGVVTG